MRLLNRSADLAPAKGRVRDRPRMRDLSFLQAYASRCFRGPCFRPMQPGCPQVDTQERTCCGDFSYNPLSDLILIEDALGNIAQGVHDGW